MLTSASRSMQIIMKKNSDSGGQSMTTYMSYVDLFITFWEYVFLLF